MYFNGAFAGDGYGVIFVDISGKEALFVLFLADDDVNIVFA